jgi:DNA-binding Lrp family transcriptional regulator
MKDNNYIVIQGWMTNELKLTGNELLVFALIYGFSQDGESEFSGSRSYIAKTLNISKPTVDKALKSLLEKRYIEKHKMIINDVQINRYKVSLQGVKELYGGSKETLPGGSKETLPNNISKINIEYKEIVDMYNDTCVSFPRVNTLSESRKKAIKARLKIYTIDDFKRMFEMAESSYFLKGGNDRNWCANFDWMIKDANMAKILDGNYNNNADIINRPNNYDKLAELERRAMNGM